MNFLENIALNYFSLYESGNAAYGFIYITALIAGFVRKVDVRMQRSTYLLNLGLVGLISAFISLVGFFYVQALLNGYLWLIFLVDLMRLVAVGYFLVFLAKARSNDAFGHSRRAFLGFVPLANFYLMGVGSKERDYYPLGKLTAGPIAGVLGVVFLFGSVALSTYSEMEIDRQSLSITQDQADALEKMRIEIRATAGDIKGLLSDHKIAVSVGNGRQIDAITKQDSVAISGNTLKVKMLITNDEVTQLRKDWQDNLREKLCLNFPEVIELGGAIEFEYASVVNGVIASVVASKEDCPK